MPVPIAGNAIVLSEFSLARFSELRVAARRFVLRCRFAQPHARRVNHMPRPQASRAGNSRLAQRDRSDPVAFLLNRRAALHANRAGDAAAEHQIVVRGVHDRVHVGVGQISLPQLDLRAPFFAHCHVIIAPTVAIRKTSWRLRLVVQIAAALVALADAVARAPIVRPGRSRWISKPRRLPPTRALRPTRSRRASKS